MKYMAKIKNGIVENIIIADYDFIQNDGDLWIECTENNYPSINDTYTETEGFRPPKPFDSWIWDDNNKLWDAPIPLPDEENIYEWDEETQSWIMIYKKV